VEVDEGVDVEEKVVPEERTFPVMSLAQTAFQLESTSPTADRVATKAKVMEAVEADTMTPYYEALCAKFGWAVDADLLARLKAANATELEGLEATMKDAKENQGEMEVLDALFALLNFHARIGEREKTYAAADDIIAPPKLSSGKRIDASMCKLRVALFNNDTEAARKLIVATKKLSEAGGDWDRRNRLKAYEAVFLMVDRDFKTAAALLLDGVATFTCTELCSYETFIFYTVVTNMLFLDRPVLKKKLVDGPEVVSVIGDLPPLEDMLRGLYDCEYAAFFASLLPLGDALAADRFLFRHSRYLVREYRITAFGQFLDAYKSVMVSTMAEAFGVSTDFLDAELSRFIAGGRLNAKIDKVGGKVETNPPDERNNQYQSVIKKGDLLLTSIQKLARVIDA
jgi:26S proteasome regulatory subunit N7